MEKMAILGNEYRVMVPYEKAPANYVPAAAVIRRERALSGIIGRKGCVDGNKSFLLKIWAQPSFARDTV